MRPGHDNVFKTLSTALAILLSVQDGVATDTSWNASHNSELNHIPQALRDTSLGILLSKDSLRLLDLENSIHLLNSRDESQSRRIAKLETQLKNMKSDISLTYAGIQRALSDGSISNFGQGAGLKSKLNNCGDIVVGDSGHVVFQSTLNHSTRTTCTWTIRVNTSEKISVKLISDTFDPSVSTLLLVPMVEISRRNISVRTLLRAQKTIFSGDRNEHTFSSPVLFVTLITESSTHDLSYQPSFILYFEGRGDPEYFSVYKFTHYHYTSNIGEISYPNGFQYETHEAVSFVLTPTYSNPGNFKVTVEYLDVQFCPFCGCDSLQFFGAEVDEHYMQWGNPNKDYRMCGDSPSSIGSDKSERWIGLFYTDGDEEGSGFKFSWNNTNA